MADPILNIICNPEIECSKTGTISDFKNIYPGFQTTRKITVINNRNSQCDLKLQTQANNSNSPIYQYTKISFSGREIDLLSNSETSIDSLSPNQKKDITMRLYVSTKADNNFANQTEKINFNFKINCAISSTSSGTVAGVSTTNNPFCSCSWWWKVILLIIIFLILILRLAKNRE